jgi:hypothetical protein
LDGFLLQHQPRVQLELKDCLQILVFCLLVLEKDKLILLAYQMAVAVEWVAQSLVHSHQKEILISLTTQVEHQLAA